MLVIYMLPAVVLVAFISLYLSRFSRPEPIPDGIRAAIPYIKNVHFEDLEAEMFEQRSNEDPDGVLLLTKPEQRSIHQERLQWLVREVRAMKSNVQLYQGGASWELEQIKDKNPASLSDRDRVAGMILKAAPSCLLALTAAELQISVAATLNHVRPSNTSLAKPLLVALEFSSRKYASLTSCALTVAHSYGHVHYENLMSAL